MRGVTEALVLPYIAVVMVSFNVFGLARSHRCFCVLERLLLAAKSYEVNNRNSKVPSCAPLTWVWH